MAKNQVSKEWKHIKKEFKTLKGEVRRSLGELEEGLGQVLKETYRGTKWVLYDGAPIGKMIIEASIFVGGVGAAANNPFVFTAAPIGLIAGIYEAAAEKDRKDGVVYRTKEELATIKMINEMMERNRAMYVIMTSGEHETWRAH